MPCSSSAARLSGRIKIARSRGTQKGAEREREEAAVGKVRGLQEQLARIKLSALSARASEVTALILQYMCVGCFLRIDG